MSDALDHDAREVIRRRIELRERDGHERLLLNHDALRALLDAADERDRLAAERDAFIAGIGFTPAADLVELVEPLSKRIGDAVEHRQCAEELAWEKRQHEARMVEVRRLQDAVERVRALHAPDGEGFCRACDYGTQHPCPTIAALDGDEQ